MSRSIPGSGHREPVAGRDGGRVRDPGVAALCAANATDDVWVRGYAAGRPGGVAVRGSGDLRTATSSPSSRRCNRAVTRRA